MSVRPLEANLAMSLANRQIVRARDYLRQLSERFRKWRKLRSNGQNGFLKNFHRPITVSKSQNSQLDSAITSNALNMSLSVMRHFGPQLAKGIPECRGERSARTHSVTKFKRHQAGWNVSLRDGVASVVVFSSPARALRALNRRYALKGALTETTPHCSSFR
jgi:hypothetical protein